MSFNQSKKLNFALNKLGLIRKFSYQMNQNDQNFIKLEQGVRRLVVAYKDVIKEKETLEKEIEALNKKISLLQSDALSMKNDNDRLKMTTALLGDETHRRLMKTRVNRLIKELDVCITQLKNGEK